MTITPGPTYDPYFISLDGEDTTFEISLIGTDGEFGFITPDSDMITDYPEKTANLLIEQFEESEKLQSFVKALATEANDVEKMFFDLIYLYSIYSTL